MTDIGKYLKNNTRWEGDCLIWTAKCKPDGYGVTQTKKLSGKYKKIVAAHRLAYTYYLGDIPEGMFVMHSCDNPPCVSIAHLSLGTPADNSADMRLKGRAAKAERNGNAKLDWDKVNFIRKNRGIFSNRLIADVFNISKTVVGLVQANISWKNA